MPRRLSPEPHTLILEDRLSGSEIHLYYRLPTTVERAAYASACVRREGDKVITDLVRARAEFGMKILTGVRQGDFEVPDSRGGYTDPHDRDDLKELLGVHASDLVEALAEVVFDRSVNAMPGRAAPGQAAEPVPSVEDAEGN